MAPRIKCPTCGLVMAWSADNAFRPFCSERCKNIDLGAWSSEQYTIPAVEPPDGGDEDPLRGA